METSCDELAVQIFHQPSTSAWFESEKTIIFVFDFRGGRAPPYQTSVAYNIEIPTYPRRRIPAYLPFGIKASCVCGYPVKFLPELE